MDDVHESNITKVANSIAGRDRVDINIYGMDEVPVKIIEERIAKKIKRKTAKLEAQLKKDFGININDPKFDLADFEIKHPRPTKRNRGEVD